MVVDVAHASFETVKDTVSVTTAPIMLSHSYLQSETSPHPRRITAVAVGPKGCAALSVSPGIIADTAMGRQRATQVQQAEDPPRDVRLGVVL